LSDILDLSRIEANKLEIREEEFNLTDVVQPIRDIFAQALQQNQNTLNVSLAADIPSRLLGDSTRLIQILFNLVGTQAGDSESPYARQFEGAGLGLPLVK
jgi:signal transduction histidine kinase